MATPFVSYETDPVEKYITEDVIVQTARNSLKGKCAWEAVDPLHQTLMGGKIQCFLKDALPALKDAGWLPPEPGYPDGLPVRSHPRGRLREVLKLNLSQRFEVVSRSVVYYIADAVYRWHLGEMRYIRLVSLAREINDLADIFEARAAIADTPYEAGALEDVVTRLRSKADEFEDQIEDPR